MSDAVDIKRARKQRAALKRKYAEISAVVERIHRQAKRLIHQRAFTCAPALELTQSDLADINKKYKAGVNEALTKSCKKVLAQLMESRLGFPFNAPVDTHKYTTYLDKVSTPMDFGTIKAKVEEGRYQSVDAFKADVMLVFSNARTFNPPGSDVYVMAEALQSDFIKSMRENLSKIVVSVEAKRKLDTESKKAEKYQSLVSAFRSSAEGDIRAFVKYLDECMLALRQAMSVSAAMTATQMPGPQDLAKLADDISALPLKYQRILQHVLDDGTEMKTPPCAEDLGKKSSLMLLQAESVLARCSALNVCAGDAADAAEAPADATERARDTVPDMAQAHAPGAARAAAPDTAQTAAPKAPPAAAPENARVAAIAAAPRETSAAAPQRTAPPASSVNPTPATEPPAIPTTAAQPQAAGDAARPAAAEAPPAATEADAGGASHPSDTAKPTPTEQPVVEPVTNSAHDRSASPFMAADGAAAMDIDMAAPETEAMLPAPLPGGTAHPSPAAAKPDTPPAQPDQGASQPQTEAAAPAQTAAEPPTAVASAVAAKDMPQDKGQERTPAAQAEPAAKPAAAETAQASESLPASAGTSGPAPPPPSSTAEAVGASTSAAAGPSSAPAPAAATTSTAAAATAAAATGAATAVAAVTAVAAATAAAAAAATATAGAAETDALKGASLPSIRVGAAAAARNAGDVTPVLQPLEAGFAGAFLKSAPPSVSPRFPLPNADPNESRGQVRNALNEAKVAWPLLPVGLGVPHVHINVNEIRRRMASNFIATRNLTVETNLVVRATNDPKSNIPLSRSANMDLALQLHRSLGNILPTSPLKRSSSTGPEELQHIAIQALAFPDPKKPLVPRRMPVVRRGATSEEAAAPDAAPFTAGRLPDCMSPTPDVAAWTAAKPKRRFRAPCHPKRSTLQAQRKDRAKVALQSLGLGDARGAAAPPETPTPASPARRPSTGALPLMSPVLPGSSSTDLARGESPRSLGKVTMKTVHAAMMAVKESSRGLDLSSSPRLAQLRTGSPRLAFQMDQELRSLTSGLSSHPSAPTTRMRERSTAQPTGSAGAASEAPVPPAEPAPAATTSTAAEQQPAATPQPATSTQPEAESQPAAAAEALAPKEPEQLTPTDTPPQRVS